MQSNDLVFTVSLPGLLNILLAIVAIVALVYLIKLFIKLSKTVGVLSELVDHNKEELDAFLKILPSLAGKADRTMGQAQNLLEASSDEIGQSVTELKTTLVNASRLSKDAADTVEYVSRSAIDAADSLTGGLAQTNSTLSYVREIAKIVRDILH